MELAMVGLGRMGMNMAIRPRPDRSHLHKNDTYESRIRL